MLTLPYTAYTTQALLAGGKKRSAEEESEGQRASKRATTGSDMDTESDKEE